MSWSFPLSTDDELNHPLLFCIKAYGPALQYWTQTPTGIQLQPFPTSGASQQQRFFYVEDTTQLFTLDVSRMSNASVAGTEPTTANIILSQGKLINQADFMSLNPIPNDIHNPNLNQLRVNFGAIQANNTNSQTNWYLEPVIYPPVSTSPLPFLLVKIKWIDPDGNLYTMISTPSPTNLKNLVLTPQLDSSTAPILPTVLGQYWEIHSYIEDTYAFETQPLTYSQIFNGATINLGQFKFNGHFPNVAEDFFFVPYFPSCTTYPNGNFGEMDYQGDLDFCGNWTNTTSYVRTWQDEVRLCLQETQHFETRWTGTMANSMNYSVPLVTTISFPLSITMIGTDGDVVTGNICYMTHSNGGACTLIISSTSNGSNTAISPQGNNMVFYAQDSTYFTEGFAILSNLLYTANAALLANSTQTSTSWLAISQSELQYLATVPNPTDPGHFDPTLAPTNPTIAGFVTTRMFYDTFRFRVYIQQGANGNGQVSLQSFELAFGNGKPSVAQQAQSTDWLIRKQLPHIQILWTTLEGAVVSPNSVSIQCSTSIKVSQALVGANGTTVNNDDTPVAMSQPRPQLSCGEYNSPQKPSHAFLQVFTLNWTALLPLGNPNYGNCEAPTFGIPVTTTNLPLSRMVWNVCFGTPSSYVQGWFDVSGDLSTGCCVANNPPEVCREFGDPLTGGSLTWGTPSCDSMVLTDCNSATRPVLVPTCSCDFPADPGILGIPPGLFYCYSSVCYSSGYLSPNQTLNSVCSSNLCLQSISVTGTAIVFQGVQTMVCSGGTNSTVIVPGGFPDTSSIINQSVKLQQSSSQADNLTILIITAGLSFLIALIFLFVAVFRS